MSFAVVATEIVAAASVDLDGIGSALTLANVAATPATIGGNGGVGGTGSTTGANGSAGDNGQIGLDGNN